MKRILIAIPILLGITILDYFIMSLAGSPMEMMLGPRVTEAALAEREAMLGLNQPVFIQYLSWLKELLQGNMGFSFRQYFSQGYCICIVHNKTIIIVYISYLCRTHIQQACRLLIHLNSQ